MMHWKYFISSFLVLFSPVGFIHGADSAQSVDRIEVKSGALLVGRIEAVTDKAVILETPYAGTIEVSLERIQRIITNQPMTGNLPQGLAIIRPPQKPLVRADKDYPEPISETPRWVIEAGLNLGGNRGNTDKFDLSATIEAELERRIDRLEMYGRYAFSENRDRVTSDELIMGGRYNNFFFDSVGIFFREELEIDDFEGLAFRSTSASGIIWKIREEKALRMEARSGLSYRFEDYKDDGSADFPGMDFGFDLNWRFVKWARFKGSFTFLPSVGDFRDYIIEQDSGLNLILDENSRWQVRFGINSKYNSQPEPNRVNADHRYYARLIAAWK